LDYYIIRIVYGHFPVVQKKLRILIGQSLDPDGSTPDGRLEAEVILPVDLEDGVDEPLTSSRLQVVGYP
jgi:hypothetical protein